MKKIKIQKFRNDQLHETFQIPVLLVNVASKFLPKAALTELEEKGININKMIELSKLNEDYTSVVEVEENGIKTRVEISLVS